MENAVLERELVACSGLRLLELGLVERTWGNVSSRVGDEYFAITPSGVSYTSLLASDVVLVNIHTLSFNATKRPSSELHIHAKIYSKFSNTNFILHTHQKWASLLSLFCATKVGIIELPFQYHNILGKRLPCAKYAQAGTEEIANNVIDAIINADFNDFQSSSGIVLMASHGVVVFAKDKNEAFSLVENLELIAKNIVKKKLSVGTLLEFTLSMLNFDMSMQGKIFDITKNKNSFCNNELSKLFPFLVDDRILGSSFSCFFAPFSNINVISYATNICYTQKNILYTNNLSPFFYEIMVYFDDVAQIAGAFFKLLDLESAQVSFEDIFLAFEDSNVLILKDYGMLIRSSSNEDAFSTINLLEKNIYAFLLSLHDPNILPLSVQNARELHVSYLKGYSKLKDK